MSKDVFKKIKKKPIIGSLLILSTILFLLCLSFIAVILALSPNDNITENVQLVHKALLKNDLEESLLLSKKILSNPNRLLEEGNIERFSSDSPNNVNVNSLGYGMKNNNTNSSVELSPSMDSFLKEREFSTKDLDEISEKLDSITERLDEPIHSTFGKKVVYVYHSHSRESFLPYLREEDPKDAFHSKVNITMVGQMLERALKQRGIGTQADSTDIVQLLDDRGLIYDSSYKISREVAISAMDESKDLEIFIDIHRDSLRREATTISIKGESHAKLLFVIGTGHKDYQKNKKFAEAINSLIEKNYPGLSKGVLEKDKKQGNGVYNQDLSPNAMIVEIGGVDNNLEELNRTVRVLSDMISEYYWHGETKTVN
ncbi:stage II sporulation protein P [Metabacillus herbersteinensis]|uniref:Stage II sporulation protein P n=1 Tax=Metabacillus herbersteinensis TaxID=283816 RepID=A0ABV6GMB8_9BACI